ncbi:hypothetical protein F511_36835 [Dorcoceras hygrometricum]|uniref:Uncharacterized protein n=1 Tax=Dorcoceras hygrometricum TaxID=472368 RepID=A0A2Z7CFU0_9LAMI|nr:hypothetical protein F511_36835 [Dorcoceras hygrometricum]
MANQINRRNVSSLTYENFPGGHPSQYCSHPCTLTSTMCFSPHSQPDQAAQRQQLDVRELPRSSSIPALSVIPSGSWDDVASRFTVIRWMSSKCVFGVTKVMSPRVVVSLNHWRSHKYWFFNFHRSNLISDRDYDEATTMELKSMFTGPGPDPNQLTWFKPMKNL